MSRHACAPFLDHEQERCRPSTPCEMQHRCLRFRAALPMRYAKLCDGMAERRNALGILSPSCAKHLPMPADEAAP